MYKRFIGELIQKKLGKGKAIILMGPRQVGKTTIIKEVLKKIPYLFLDCDDPLVRNRLTLPNTEQLRSIIGKHKTVFIDEAQRVEEIGITLKIITDQFKNVQLIVSGSSSFDLAGKINEPLTGRKWEYEMFPITWQEFENHNGYLVSEQQLENRLLYGFYPDVLNHPGEEKEVLKNIVSSYLFKDILSYAGIKKPEILEKLVQALALQIGSEVSYNELSQLVGVDKNTISKYIDILQKGYIIFKLGCYSKNSRDEIKTNKKIYFYDNGIRNMVIGNFIGLDLRTDKGVLWENFLISERVKQNKYNNRFAKSYFWRTIQQQEVDYVEELEGKIFGYELKWKAKENLKLPKPFMERYNAEGQIIDTKNYRNFVNLK